MKNNKYDHSHAQEDLFETLTLIKNSDQMQRFLKDLCTPQELAILAERWRVCKLLNDGTRSYREISEETGASLATITRVARFLKNEPHQGYKMMLEKITIKKDLA